MTPHPFLVDSHCHLQYLEPAERAAAVERARSRGVEVLLIPATKLDQAEELLAWCDSNPFTWCALGAHPHDASTWRDGDELRLADLVKHPKVVAVGECGLDFFYDHSPREVQEETLRAQWRVAIAAGLPAIVHNRDSNERMLAIVAEPEFSRLRADFHSFAGGVEMARTLVARDFAFGFSGMITFARADNVRAVLRAEAYQHHGALPVLHRNRGRFLRDDLLAEQPPALQDVAIDVSREDVHVLAAIRRRDLVHLAAAHEERQTLVRHPIAQRVLVVEAHT